MTDEDDVVRPVAERLLSDEWGQLTQYEFDLKRRSGDWQRQRREVYDRGNGATCLLYDPETECVLLTRQFRLPAYLNGGESTLIETPAGLLEGADALTPMRLELIEETGYHIDRLVHVFDAYMSPGSVTEIISHFVGIYARADKASEGGGKHDEGEDIEVLHVPLGEALAMVRQGEIRDAKTILLLQHLALNGAPPGDLPE